MTDKLAEIKQHWEKFGIVGMTESDMAIVFAALEEAEQRERWIPVTESMPGIGQRVWVIIDGFVQVTPCHFDGEVWEWLNEAGDPAPKEVVSHWQNYALPKPLSAPPEKK